jgi:hypothetical protein
LGHIHRGQRSAESREFRKARQYCFEHCMFDGEQNEFVFLGEPEKVVAFVKIAVKNAYLPEVPETPHSLILADSRGRGAFQQ